MSSESQTPAPAAEAGGTVKTGAQIVVDTLVDLGVETMFGYPGRGGAAPVRPAVRRPDPVHPPPPRAGRLPHGRRLRPRHRQGRRCPGHQRPRGQQPGHRPGHRHDGLGPDGRHHRPGPHRPDRQRCLPGGRHDRHHPPGHQAQLHRQGRQGPGADGPRGVPHRPHRPARPGPGRPARGRHGRQVPVQRQGRDRPARLPDPHQGPRPPDLDGRRGDQRGRAARPLRRRRASSSPTPPRSCGRWPRRPICP